MRSVWASNTIRCGNTRRLVTFQAPGQALASVIQADNQSIRVRSPVALLAGREAGASAVKVQRPGSGPACRLEAFCRSAAAQPTSRSTEAGNRLYAARNRADLGLERCGCCKNLLHVPGNADLAPHLRDLAVRPDQVGRAVDAHVLLAVHALLDPGAKGLDNGPFGVRAQGEAQAVLLLELVVAGGTVLGHADDIHARGLELVVDA